MVGVCGSVGSTVALGVAALRNKLTNNSGLVTELPAFGEAGLIAPSELIIGGHEIGTASLLDSVKSLHDRAGLFSENVIRRCSAHVRSMQRNVKRGTVCGGGSNGGNPSDPSLNEADATPAEAVERLTDDLESFRRTHKLDHVVVVNVASSEPGLRRATAHSSFKKLQRAMTKPSATLLPPSALYALAAIEARCAYVNFTPSTGVCVPAIQERAKELGVPYMGNDGKTGETLVKSALAPMFALRNLPVLSWVGSNLLGNSDGATLKDPKTRASKLKSKDKTVAHIVGHDTMTSVSIDFVPSLHDWKVAWDFIHFEGFLGTKMSLQFTWQGSDSILAAPLVIDLARLAARECQAQRGGPMSHLGFFFKDPIGAKDFDLATQWRALIEHVSADD